MANNLQEIQNVDGIFNIEKMKILKEVESLSRGYIVRTQDRIEIKERRKKKKMDEPEKQDFFDNNWKKLIVSEEILKKLPLGTRITKKDGTKMYLVNNGLKTNIKIKIERKILYNQISKIEIPNYKVIYQDKILDEIEKKYLKSILKPFKTDIEHITKKATLDLKKEFIKIKLKNDSFKLPVFEKGIMYKGMEEDVEYTLKDLKIF